MGNSEDVEAALNAAVADKSESSTGKEEVDSTKEVQDAKKDDGQIPRSRLNELSTKFQDAETSWVTEKGQLMDKLAVEQQKALDLAESVAASRSDTELVASLQTLARNPAHSELIGRVNAALSGDDYEAVEDDVDDNESDASSKEATQAIDKKSILAEVRNEMEEALTEQRQTVLLQQSELIAQDLMRQLPSEKYSDAAKDIISKLWAAEVDWVKLEADPSSLNAHLAEKLDATLKDWEAAHPASEVGEETNDEDKPTLTPEKSLTEEIGQILNRNWGETNEVDGKQLASLSDSEFQSGFGSMFRKLNKLNLGEE